MGKKKLIFQIVAWVTILCFLTYDFARAYPDYRRTSTNTLAPRTLITSTPQDKARLAALTKYIALLNNTNFKNKPISDVQDEIKRIVNNLWTDGSFSGEEPSIKKREGQVFVPLGDGYQLRYYNPKIERKDSISTDGFDIVHTANIHKYLSWQLLKVKSPDSGVNPLFDALNSIQADPESFKSETVSDPISNALKILGVLDQLEYASVKTVFIKHMLEEEKPLPDGDVLRKIRQILDLIGTRYKWDLMDNVTSKEKIDLSKKGQKKLEDLENKIFGLFKLETLENSAEHFDGKRSEIVEAIGKIKQHCEDVASLAQDVAKECGYENVEEVHRLAAVAHDIGKLINSGKLLLHGSNKRMRRGKSEGQNFMTQEETERIKEHSRDSFAILRKNKIILPVETILIIALNHEPEFEDLLKEINPELAARINEFSISDQFCALSERRGYLPNRNLGNISDFNLWAKETVDTRLSMEYSQKIRQLLAKEVRKKEWFYGESFSPGRVLFVDPMTGEVRALEPDEHEALNEALKELIFTGNLKNNNNAALLDSSYPLWDYVNKENGKRDSKPVNIYVVDNDALEQKLGEKYSYIAEGLVTHAGTFKGNHNMFITNTIYMSLSSFLDVRWARLAALDGFLDLWRLHEKAHFRDKNKIVDKNLSELEQQTAEIFLYVGKIFNNRIISGKLMYCYWKIIVSGYKHFMYGKRRKREMYYFAGKMHEVYGNISKAIEEYSKALKIANQRQKKIVIGHPFEESILNLIEKKDYGWKKEHFTRFLNLLGKNDKVSKDLLMTRYFSTLPILCGYVKKSLDKSETKLKDFERNIIVRLLNLVETGSIYNPTRWRSADNILSYVYYLAGEMYFREGTFEKAVWYYEKSIAIKGSPEMAYVQLAYSYVMRDGDKESVVMAEKILAKGVKKYGPLKLFMEAHSNLREAVELEDAEQKKINKRYLKCFELFEAGDYGEVIAEISKTAKGYKIKKKELPPDIIDLSKRARMFKKAKAKLIRLLGSENKAKELLEYINHNSDIQDLKTSIDSLIAGEKEGKKKAEAEILTLRQSIIGGPLLEVQELYELTIRQMGSGKIEQADKNLINARSNLEDAKRKYHRLFPYGDSVIIIKIKALEKRLSEIENVDDRQKKSSSNRTTKRKQHYVEKSGRDEDQPDLTSVKDKQSAETPEIYFSNLALRELESKEFVEKGLKKSILAEIKQVASQMTSSNKHSLQVVKRLKPYELWRIRVRGNYRVIFAFIDGKAPGNGNEKKDILILSVLNRGDDRYENIKRKVEFFSNLERHTKNPNGVMGIWEVEKTLDLVPKTQKAPGSDPLNEDSRVNRVYINSLILKVTERTNNANISEAANCINSRPPPQDKGDILSGFKHILANKTLKENSFIREEFRIIESRLNLRTKAHFSYTTITTELEGMVELGILDVDKTRKVFRYKLNERYLGAPSELIGEVEYLLGMLMADPTDKELAEVKESIKKEFNLWTEEEDAGDKTIPQSIALKEMKFCLYSDLDKSLKNRNLYALVRTAYREFGYKGEVGDEFLKEKLEFACKKNGGKKYSDVMFLFVKDEPVGLYTFTIFEKTKKVEANVVYVNPNYVRMGGIGPILQKEMLISVKEKGIQEVTFGTLMDPIRKTRTIQMCHETFLKKYPTAVKGEVIRDNAGNIVNFTFDLKKYNPVSANKGEKEKSKWTLEKIKKNAEEIIPLLVDSMMNVSPKLPVEKEDDKVVLLIDEDLGEFGNNVSLQEVKDLIDLIATKDQTNRFVNKLEIVKGRGKGLLNKRGKASMKNTIVVTTAENAGFFEGQCAVIAGIDVGDKFSKTAYLPLIEVTLLTLAKYSGLSEEKLKEIYSKIPNAVSIDELLKINDNNNVFGADIAKIIIPLIPKATAFDAEEFNEMMERLGITLRNA